MAFSVITCLCPVVAFVLVLLQSGPASGVLWLRGINGSIPDKAFFYEPKRKEFRAYFCSIFNETTGTTHTGMLQSDRKVCEYITAPHVFADHPERPEVFSSSKYKVLTREDDEEFRMVNLRKGATPSSATVRCDDEESTDCYLGQSLYSDGLCIEDIGKVHTDTNLIHMVKDRKTQLCPFYVLLEVRKVKEEDSE